MKKLSSLSLLLAVSLFHTAFAAEPATELTVSAAISMKESLTAVARDFENSHAGTKVLLNFASSGALQKQIENGAPVDVFVSAGMKEMNALDQQSLLEPGSRGDLLENTLVLVTPKEVEKIHALGDLQSDDVKRLAVGDPKSVPAGLYAQQALKFTQLTAALQSKLVLAENVRQVLAYVESGNVDAGIVYATDAQASSKVRVAFVFPAESHEPIVYPAAVLKASKQEKTADEFLAFLHSETAKQEFVKAGFQPVSK
ncbi:MAG: molybdate ABC transporter substrate-binding protein [Chthoniobacteraceae bacterium]